MDVIARPLRGRREAHGFGKGCGGGNAPDIYNFMHEVRTHHGGRTTKGRPCFRQTKQCDLCLPCRTLLTNEYALLYYGFARHLCCAAFDRVTLRGAPLFFHGTPHATSAHPHVADALQHTLHLCCALLRGAAALPTVTFHPVRRKPRYPPRRSLLHSTVHCALLSWVLESRTTSKQQLKSDLTSLTFLDVSIQAPVAFLGPRPRQIHLPNPHMLLYPARAFPMPQVGLPDETCNAYVAQASDSCDAEAMCMNCMVLVRGERREFSFHASL